MFIRMLGALVVATLCSMTVAGCGDGGAPGGDPDAGVPDGSVPDGSVPDGSVPDGGIPPGPSIVVDTDWLEQHLGSPDVQLVDTRTAGYDDSRIPGAILLRPSQLATTVDGVPAQAVPPTRAQAVLRATGLRNQVIAVVYGAPPEYNAARIAWSLRYYGHPEVRYLDGGYAAWVDSGGAVDTGPPVVEPTEYTIAEVEEDLRVTGDWVLMQLGDPPYDMPAIQLVDARSEAEYLDDGRIPTARSVDWGRNLDEGLLRSDAELEALYDGMDYSVTTVTYCVSGWRGSFAWLTLTDLGYQDVRLYDGSWNEWGNGEFPVER
jgi:thiosulfate/3-mercaptopyruvate sulfurtransferase